MYREETKLVKTVFGYSKDDIIAALRQWAGSGSLRAFPVYSSVTLTEAGIEFVVEEPFTVVPATETIEEAVETFNQAKAEEVAECEQEALS